MKISSVLWEWIRENKSQKNLFSSRTLPGKMEEGINHGYSRDGWTENQTMKYRLSWESGTGFEIWLPMGLATESYVIGSESQATKLAETEVL